MANLFDTANFPTTEPRVLVEGDRITWKRSDLGSDYSPALYTLKYSARLENTTTDTKIDITASASGNDFVITVPAATSGQWAIGRYHWQAYIERNSDNERITVDSGQFEVKANRATEAGDPRGHVKKVLDAIEAVIENRATKGQESYAIAGRSLARTPIADLLLLRDKYSREFDSMAKAARIAKGMAAGNVLHVRLS
jgi:hypothetical protein